MSETSFILTLTSDPLPGIIAAVSTAVAELGGNITEANQHWDRPADRFFLRVAFVGPEGSGRKATAARETSRASRSRCDSMSSSALRRSAPSWAGLATSSSSRAARASPS